MNNHHNNGDIIELDNLEEAGNKLDEESSINNEIMV